jgi:hypothetical protein
MKPMRAKGTVVTLPEEPKGVLADEAKQLQKQRQERRIIEGRRPPRPLLNKQTYAELYEKWKASGSRKLPVCRRCREAVIHWDEPAHVCEGFKPQFVEHDEAWHERMEARREAIREAKRNGTFFSEDEDDLSGYEDEPEEDWCDQDDGDPMWE